MGIILIGFFIIIVVFIVAVQIVIIAQDKKRIRELIEENGLVVKIGLGSPFDCMVYSGAKHSYTNYYRVQYIDSNGILKKALMKSPDYDGLVILEEKVIKISKK